MLDKIYLRFYSERKIGSFCSNIKKTSVNGIETYIGFFHNFRVSAQGILYHLEGSLSTYYFNDASLMNYISLDKRTCSLAISKLSAELNMDASQIEVYGLEWGMEVILPRPVTDYLSSIQGMKDDRRRYKNRLQLDSTLYLYNRPKYPRKRYYEQALVLYDKVKEMKANHQPVETDCNILKIEMRLLYDLKRKLGFKRTLMLSDLCTEDIFYFLYTRFSHEVYGLYGFIQGNDTCETESLKDAKTFIFGAMASTLQVSRERVKAIFPNLSVNDRCRLNKWIDDSIKFWGCSCNAANSLVDELRNEVVKQMPIR